MLRRPALLHRIGRPLTVALLLALPLTASAGGTKTFDVSDFDELDEGEVEGAAIEGRGVVTPGYTTTHTAIDGTTAAFSCLASGKTAYVGTADEAKIFKVTAKGKKGEPKVDELAKLDGAVVSAMASLKGGDLVAATLPGGKLVRVSKKGKVTPFAELKDVEQVWAIVPHQGRLLVATGPKGQLFSVSMDGKDQKVVLDVDEKHLLSVLPVGKKVLVGTSPKARLYELLPDDTDGLLVHDFKGDELRGLAIAGRYLVAAVNEFEDRGVSSVKSLEKQLARTSLSGAPETSTKVAASTPKAEAKIYGVDLGAKQDLLRASDAAWETWLEKEKQYFTDLEAVDGTGLVLVSSSRDGKIYRVRGRRDVATVADLEERQATGLCKLSGSRWLATAGDGSAVYRLDADKAAKAKYVSEVFDAEQPADFGRLEVRGEGGLKVSVRTGPGDEPDDRWSAWKAVPVKREGIVLAGELDVDRRRYIQLRVELDRKATLRGFSFFYAPENLAPLLTKIDVETPDFDVDDEEEPDAETTIKWTAEERDDDDLVYSVAIRPEGGKDDEWVDLSEDPTSKKELEVDLDSIPDGVYEVGITASDEPSNGTARARTDHLVSDPFIVDRTRPRIDSAKVDGMRVSGTASDKGSRIHDVSYSVDGSAFRVASPVDGMYDSVREQFDAKLPDDLRKGNHRLVIRARDAHGNIVTEARTFRVD